VFAECILCILMYTRVYIKYARVYMGIYWVYRNIHEYMSYTLSKQIWQTEIMRVNYTCSGRLEVCLKFKILTFRCYQLMLTYTLYLRAWSIVTSCQVLNMLHYSEKVDTTPITVYTLLNAISFVALQWTNY